MDDLVHISKKLQLEAAYLVVVAVVNGSDFLPREPCGHLAGAKDLNVWILGLDFGYFGLIAVVVMFMGDNDSDHIANTC